MSGDELTRAAASSGVTANAIVQAAWALVLAKYVGESDVVFGTTRACRSSGPAEYRDVIGVRINSVPRRVQCSGSTTVRDLVRAVREQHLAVRPYENTPLSSIREWSSSSDVEPFDTLVVFENEDQAYTVRQQSKGQWHTSFRHTAYTHYPLTLVAHERPAPFFSILYRTDLYDARFVERLASHFARVVQHVMREPDRRVSELRLLDETERAEVVETWNATTGAWPERRVHEVFEAQVERTPGAIAVVEGRCEVTYAEVNARANQLARYLREQGVGGGRVGVCVNRSVEMVVAVVAALKAGAAYVPLDATYPDARLSFMVRDAAPAVVVTTERLAGRMAVSGCPVVCVDRDAAVIARQEATNLGEAGSLEDLIYIIYTSGRRDSRKGSRCRIGASRICWRGTGQCIGRSRGRCSTRRWPSMRAVTRSSRPCAGAGAWC